MFGLCLDVCLDKQAGVGPCSVLQGWRSSLEGGGKCWKAVGLPVATVQAQPAMAWCCAALHERLLCSETSMRVLCHRSQKTLSLYGVRQARLLEEPAAAPASPPSGLPSYNWRPHTAFHWFLGTQRGFLSTLYSRDQSTALGKGLGTRATTGGWPRPHGGRLQHGCSI
jgi:hypothetical protein